MYADAYDYDETMSPRIVILYNGSAQAGAANFINPPYTATVYVVESVTDIVTDDGDKTKRLYVYANQKFTAYDIDPVLYDVFVSKNVIPQPGDIVRLSIGSKYINGIAIDMSFDINLKKANISYTGDISTNPSATLTYVSGKVFSMSENGPIVLQTDNYPASSSYPAPIDGLCSVKPDNNSQVVIFDTQLQSISHGRINEIKDIRSVGTYEASYICARLNGYDPRLIVIYQ